VGFQNLEAADPALPDRPGAEKKKKHSSGYKIPKFSKQTLPKLYKSWPKGLGSGKNLEENQLVYFQSQINTEVL
jgi:hypothetical protein